MEWEDVTVRYPFGSYRRGGSDSRRPRVFFGTFNSSKKTARVTNSIFTDTPSGPPVVSDRVFDKVLPASTNSPFGPQETRKIPKIFGGP